MAFEEKVTELIVEQLGVSKEEAVPTALLWSPRLGVANVIRIAGSACPCGVQSALTQDSAGQVPSPLSSM